MPGPKLENADSGTMVSTRVLTDAPVEAPPRALLVSAFSCWLRTRVGGDAAAARRGAWPLTTTCVRARDRAGRLRAADRAARGADIDVLQRLRALPELRRHLHHDMILVEIVVDRRDLALAEGVVERVVDLRRGDAEPRRRGAVDREFDLQPLVLAVGIDVLELGHVLQRVGDLRHPFVRDRPACRPGSCTDRRRCPAARRRARPARALQEQPRAGDAAELGAQRAR